MKFQNSSILGFKVMLCIKKRDERTDGRTNNPEAICPSNFFEVGGITSRYASYFHYNKSFEISRQFSPKLQSYSLLYPELWKFGFKFRNLIETLALFAK